MTKKELIKALDEIASKMDILVADMRTSYKDAADIFTAIENLPTEPEDIEDIPSEETDDQRTDRE